MRFFQLLSCTNNLQDAMTLTGKIKDVEERATTWENRYRVETVNRSLQDAAVGADAFQPSQIVTLLKPMTRLVEEVDPKTGKSTGRFNSMIDFPDVDAEGNPTVSTLSPKDAVKRMKELPDTFERRVDLRALASDPKRYREAREKNPELFGLRPRICW